MDDPPGCYLPRYPSHRKTSLPTSTVTCTKMWGFHRPSGPATPHTSFSSNEAPKYPIKPRSSTSQGPWEIYSNDRDVLLFGKGLSSSNSECIFNHFHITMKSQVLLLCVRWARGKKKANVKCSSLVHLGTSWGLERPWILAVASEV